MQTAPPAGEARSYDRGPQRHADLARRGSGRPQPFGANVRCRLQRGSMVSVAAVGVGGWPNWTRSGCWQGERADPVWVDAVISWPKPSADGSTSRALRQCLGSRGRSDASPRRCRRCRRRTRPMSRLRRCGISSSCPFRAPTMSIVSSARGEVGDRRVAHDAVRRDRRQATENSPCRVDEPIDSGQAMGD